jgi:hypothetical protein
MQRAAAGTQRSLRLRAGKIAVVKPRRHHSNCWGASELAAGLPGIPEAAHIVDGFYLLPPCSDSPAKGIASDLFPRKRSGNGHQPLPLTL